MLGIKLTGVKKIMDVISKPKDKRRERGEASRRHILKAAITSIATQGLGSMTLDRVADKAGISRALVVFHFKSKDKLITEVLEYLGAQYASGWLPIVEAEAESSMAKLFQLVEYDIRFACENPKYVSAWHAYWGESKGKKMFHDLGIPRDEGYAADMQRLIEQINDEEGYGMEDIKTVARGLQALMFGTWVLLHLNPQPNDYEANMSVVRLYLGRLFPDTEILS